MKLNGLIVEALEKWGCECVLSSSIQCQNMINKTGKGAETKKYSYLGNLTIVKCKNCEMFGLNSRTCKRKTTVD